MMNNSTEQWILGMATFMIVLVIFIIIVVGVTGSNK